MPVSKKRVKKQGKNAQFRAKVRESRNKVREYEAFVERVRANAVQLGEYAAQTTRHALSLEQLVLRTRAAIQNGEASSVILEILDEAIGAFFVNKEVAPTGVKGDGVNPALTALEGPVVDLKATLEELGQ